MPQCQSGTFPYTIRQGDNLWQLAQKYNTTVSAITAVNTTLNPYSLKIGQIICIPTGNKISKAELDLRNIMRLLWSQHVAWTRMAIISMAENLPDVNFVTNRLLRNPSDFEAALRPIYGNEIASKFASLLKDHLVIASELVKAAKAKDTAAVAAAEKRWYENADEIAAFLSSINPYLSKEALTSMLHNHLALTEAEAVAILNKDYAKSIALYDNIEKQALEMADALTEGIVKQFPNRF